MIERARKWAVLSPIIAVAVAVAASCRDPTEVVLHVTTTSQCGTGAKQIGTTTIYVARDPETAEARMQSHSPEAQTSSCAAGGEIGTLVLTPSGSSGAVVIVAGVNGKNPTECSENAFDDCIVARRSFSFAAHTPLHLPVVLDVDCAGVACDPNSTCEHGQCYASDVGCRAGQDCADPEQQADGAVADVAAPDAELDASAIDATLLDASDGGVLVDSGDSGTISMTMNDGGKEGGSQEPYCTQDKSFANLRDVFNCAGSPCVSEDICCVAPVGPTTKPSCRLDQPASMCMSALACCSNVQCASKSCCKVSSNPFIKQPVAPCVEPGLGEIGQCL
jgi:hypothetical protein